MRDFIYSVMQDYSVFVIFFHVVGASVWVGGMVALLFLTREPGSQITLELRAAGQAALYKKFFTFLSPFVFLLFVTALFMALGYKDNAIDVNGFTLNFKNLVTYKLIHTKGSIWTIMVMNMGFMIWILNKASCKLCKAKVSADSMWLVNKYLLPINILLGLVGIFLGVFLRSTF
ncbi:MAG: hypothetical protein PHV62_01020 [Sulfuricurvum sp.]|nr:hypothetical protein [Sulfuricurvum sp.]